MLAFPFGGPGSIGGYFVGVLGLHRDAPRRTPQLRCGSSVASRNVRNAVRIWPTVCVYVHKGSPVEILITAQWNPIGRSVTAPSARVIAQQYFSDTFVSMCFYFRKEKFGARCRSVTISNYFTFPK